MISSATFTSSKGAVMFLLVFPYDNVGSLMSIIFLPLVLSGLYPKALEIAPKGNVPY
jgi:hypothetical protein